MAGESREVTIEERRYSYNAEEDGNVHHFVSPGSDIRVREWTWGEKNDTLSLCTAYANTEQGISIDAARYSVELISRCVTGYSIDGAEGELTVEAFRELPADFGDQLMAVTQYVLDGALSSFKVAVEHGPGKSVVRIDDAEYCLRGWSWGEKNDVTAACIRRDEYSEAYAIDVAMFNEHMLATCLTAAPFSVHRESLRLLPSRTGDLLLDEAQRLSMLSEEVKKNSGERSDREARIQP